VFDRYRQQVMPPIAAHGGKFIVRGSKLTVLEGEWPMPLRHPRFSRARGRRALVPVAGGSGNLIIVDGV